MLTGSYIYLPAGVLEQITKLKWKKIEIWEDYEYDVR